MVTNAITNRTQVQNNFTDMPNDATTIPCRQPKYPYSLTYLLRSHEQWKCQQQQPRQQGQT